MTLTVLGLSLRDETLVKSLLNVVGGNTRAEWRFVDEIDADLALCDPQSPFARMALNKSRRSGRPCCVALLYGEGTASPLARSIRAPLRVGEFVHMLDALSDLGDMAQPAAVDNALSGLGGVQNGAGKKDAVNLNFISKSISNDRIETAQPLIDVVHQLVATHDASQPPAVWRIQMEGLSFDLRLPERRYIVSDQNMTLDALVEKVLSARVDNVINLDKTDADASRAAQADSAWDVLLWRVGLRITPHVDMPWLKDDVALRLKRWPDFGRLGAQKPHLVLAALLTKASWRSDAVLEASGQSLAELQSFVCACGLSGLLDIEHVAPLASVPPKASRRLGVSGLFRNLRSALRMGG